jgi:hypothetical protein
MKKNLEVTRKCLTMISRIAARGACSSDAQNVADTLMELTYALLELRRCTDASDPVHEYRTRDLDRMHKELDFIDSTSQNLNARDALKFTVRSTWN